MNVVNSRLLFIDSESVHGTGREFKVFLDTTKVRTYNDNQLLGVSLQSFSGYRNFPHINNTNDESIVRISNQCTGTHPRTCNAALTLLGCAPPRKSAGGRPLGIHWDNGLEAGSGIPSFSINPAPAQPQPRVQGFRV